MRNEYGTMGQRQEEYENMLEKAVEELAGFATDTQSAQIREKVKEIMDSAQNAAFMEGYIYAIAVLEETLGNMK